MAIHAIFGSEVDRLAMLRPPVDGRILSIARSTDGAVLKEWVPIWRASAGLTSLARMIQRFLSADRLWRVERWWLRASCRGI